MTFNKLKYSIDHAPMTWLPALFVAVVKACLRDKVFTKGAMSKYCRAEEVAAMVKEDEAR